MGKKRASPGADTEKNALGEAELSDVHSVKLEQICEAANRVDISIGARQPSPNRIASFLMGNLV